MIAAARRFGESAGLRIELRERVEDRRIRSLRELSAIRCRDADACPEQRIAELGDEAALSDSGFARHEHEAAATGSRELTPFLQEEQLLVTADKRAADDRRRDHLPELARIPERAFRDEDAGICAQGVALLATQ